MKLSGDYNFDDLKRTLQGNFSCITHDKNSKGKALPPEEQYVRLELFFLAFEFYKYTGKVKVYTLSEDENGVKKMTPLCTLG